MNWSWYRVFSYKEIWFEKTRTPFTISSRKILITRNKFYIFGKISKIIYKWPRNKNTKIKFYLLWFFDFEVNLKRFHRGRISASFQWSSVESHGNFNLFTLRHFNPSHSPYFVLWKKDRMIFSFQRPAIDYFFWFYERFSSFWSIHRYWPQGLIL